MQVDRTDVALPASREIARHELYFQALFQQGRSYAFPCDAQGRVDLDALSARALANYLYARAMVGRELAFPSIESSS